MKEYYSVLSACPIFKNIHQDDFSHILSCLNISTKKYKADDYIFLLGDTVDSIGIVLSGTVEIIKENLIGNRHIIASLSPSSIFGEGVVCTAKRLSPVTAMTKTDATILFIPYQKIITTCEHSCGFHIQLIHNMMLILGEKNYMLNHKIDLLVLKGMREKLASYLLYEMVRAGNSRFEIPFSRNALAEYLNVSRPSMSRELADMKEEGILDYHMNSFHIISLEKLKQCIDDKGIYE